MWQQIVINISKITMRLSRLLGKHGTALPGLVVERLSPKILHNLLAQIEGGVYLVTGTNGKTTTAKIVRQILESLDYRVLANRSGSNYTRGILSSIIEHTDRRGKLPYDIAIIEVDEAYMPQIARAANPKGMLVLNIVRDQLDRYGEIDNTANIIGSAIEYCDKVVLNADDLPVANLNKYCKNKSVSYFGVSTKLKQYLPSDKELHANKSDHLTSAGQEKLVELIDVSKHRQDFVITLKVGQQEHKQKLLIEGIHNAVNVTAAIALLMQIIEKVDKKVLRALEDIKPAFGRGERLLIDNVPVHLALVKNPAGFNQNLRAFVSSNTGGVLIAINDRYADGRDVSWLWDVDISKLENLKSSISTTGLRAYDIALRIHHRDIKVDSIETVIPVALRNAISKIPDGKELLVLPTYTAMLEIRKILAKKTKTEEIWH